jgi:hypothetical protein
MWFNFSYLYQVFWYMMLWLQVGLLKSEDKCIMIFQKVINNSPNDPRRLQSSATLMSSSSSSSSSCKLVLDHVVCYNFEPPFCRTPYVPSAPSPYLRICLGYFSYPFCWHDLSYSIFVCLCILTQVLSWFLLLFPHLFCGPILYDLLYAS